MAFTIEGITRDSFIFKINQEQLLEKSILSRPFIENSVASKYDNGPDFRDDLTITTGYNGSRCHCEPYGYHRHIRSTDRNFVVADYEVFKVVKS